MALGQGYPSQPVTFVVGFGAGGGTDLTGRGLAQAMGEYWGVTTTVVNVTGGSGGIAAEQVINAPRNGYTILVSPEIMAAQAVMDFHPTTAFSDWQHFTAAGFNGVISVRPLPGLGVLPGGGRQRRDRRGVDLDRRATRPAPKRAAPPPGHVHP